MTPAPTAGAVSSRLAASELAGAHSRAATWRSLPRADPPSVHASVEPALEAHRVGVAGATCPDATSRAPRAAIGRRSRHDHKRPELANHLKGLTIASMCTKMFKKAHTVRPRWVSVVLLVLILVAAILRLWHLDVLPPGCMLTRRSTAWMPGGSSREDTYRSTLPETMDGSRSSSICRRYRYGS